MQQYLLGVISIVAISVHAMEIAPQIDATDRSIIDEIVNTILYERYKNFYPEKVSALNQYAMTPDNVPRDIIDTIATYLDIDSHYTPTTFGWLLLSRARGYQLVDYMQSEQPYRENNQSLNDHCTIILPQNLNIMLPVKCIHYGEQVQGNDIVAYEHDKCRPDVQCFVDYRDQQIRHDNDYKGNATVVQNTCMKHRNNVYGYDGLNKNNNGLIVVKNARICPYFALVSMHASPNAHTFHKLIGEKGLAVVTAQALDYDSDTIVLCTKERTNSLPYTVHLISMTHGVQSKVYKASIPSRSRIMKCSLFTGKSGICVNRNGTLYTFGVVNDALHCWRQKTQYADGAPMKIEQYAVNGVCPTKLLLLDNRRIVYHADLTQAQQRFNGSFNISLHKITQLPLNAHPIQRLWYFGNTFSYKIPKCINFKPMLADNEDDWFIYTFNVVPYTKKMAQHLLPVLYKRQ